ncbi:MAG: hypothetical protein PHP44_14505, partial [Kiritimatiellae bacterium]|nr:hypothetical protein [Kiritimatiellia bacterium]
MGIVDFSRGEAQYNTTKNTRFENCSLKFRVGIKKAFHAGSRYRWWSLKRKTKEGDPDMEQDK